MDTDPAQAGKSAVRAWYIKTNDLGKADIGDSKCIQKIAILYIMIIMELQ